MTVLIGHGYVGQAIAAALRNAGIPFTHQHHQNWKAGRFELIINAAGYLGDPNIDSCETHRRETISGNTLLPLALADRGRPVIHISTGCLYQGDNGGDGWRETDEPNFEGSLYSLSKRLAEEALLSASENVWILRIRQPFGPKANKRNLLTKLSTYKKLMDVENSISHIDDVARAVVAFMHNRPAAGIYHCTNPGSVSVREIADLLGLEKEWFTPEEFTQACPTPRSNCVLNVKKLSAFMPLRSIWEALEDAKRQYQL